jgi:hypothetical protein
MSADISVIFVGEDGWTDMARDLPEERATTAHGLSQAVVEGREALSPQRLSLRGRERDAGRRSAAVVEVDGRDDPRSDVQRAI